MDKSLEYRNVEIAHSVIVLTMPQRAIKSIVTESAGVIDSAEVKVLDALVNAGELTVGIKGLGRNTTDNIVTVDDCNPDKFRGHLT